MTRPLRIGHQLSARIEGDPVETAVRAEALGFDIVLAADHVGPGWSPMPTLSAIASATDRLDEQVDQVRAGGGDRFDDFAPVLEALR